MPAGTQLTFDNNTANPVFVSSTFTTTYVQRVVQRLRRIRSLLILKIRSLWNLKALGTLGKTGTMGVPEAADLGVDPRVRRDRAENGSVIWKV